MLNFKVEKTLILTFGEEELPKVNRVLELNAGLEDDIIIGIPDLNLLFKTGLINNEDFNEISKMDGVTKIVVVFKEK